MPRWSISLIRFPQPLDDSLYQRIRIALVFGNFGSKAGGVTVAQIVRKHALKESVAQHGRDAVTPVFNAARTRALALLQIGAIAFNGLKQFIDARSVAG